MQYLSRFPNSELLRPEGRGFLIQQKILPAITSLAEIIESSGFSSTGNEANTVHEPCGKGGAIVDANTDQIIGFAMLGVNAGEVTSEVQLAMQNNMV